MNKTQSTKLIHPQNPPTSTSTQEALLLKPTENTIQSLKSINTKTSSTPSAQPNRFPDPLISSRLKTQAKLSQLQVQKTKQILETLQSTPSINSISKSLASGQLNHAQSVPSLNSKYVSSLLFSSKVHKLHKFYKRGLIYKARICLDHLDLRPSNCKSPLAYKISRSSYTSENLHQKMLENYYSRDKNKRLTKAKVAKTKINLMQLDSMSRSEVWIKQKIQNLAKTKQEIEEKYWEQCTFSPQLSPKSKNWKNDRTETSLAQSVSLSPVFPLMPSQSLLKEESLKEPARAQQPNGHERIERMDKSHGMNNFTLEELEKSRKSFRSVNLSPHSKKISFR